MQKHWRFSIFSKSLHLCCTTKHFWHHATCTEEEATGLGKWDMQTGEGNIICHRFKKQILTQKPYKSLLSDLKPSNSKLWSKYEQHKQQSLSTLALVHLCTSTVPMTEMVQQFSKSTIWIIWVLCFHSSYKQHINEKPVSWVSPELLSNRSWCPPWWPVGCETGIRPLGS